MDGQRRLRPPAGNLWVAERPLVPFKLDPLLIRDRAAARASLQAILAWDIDRVVVAHGDVLETGGCAALARGYAWLFEDRR